MNGVFIKTRQSTRFGRGSLGGEIALAYVISRDVPVLEKTFACGEGGSASQWQYSIHVPRTDTSFFHAGPDKALWLDHH
jgi:hypothetical protein